MVSRLATFAGLRARQQSQGDFGNTDAEKPSPPVCGSRDLGLVILVHPNESRKLITFWPTLVYGGVRVGISKRAEDARLFRS